MKAPRVKRMTVKEGEQAAISRFPNFSVTGSVTGMRKLYYGNDAYLVRCGRYIYKVDAQTYHKAK